MLKEPGISKLLIIGIIIAVFQQWCGINVIFNYAQEIFSSAGYSVSDILFNIVITGSVNLAFWFDLCSWILVYLEKTSRDKRKVTGRN